MEQRCPIIRSGYTPPLCSTDIWRAANWYFKILKTIQIPVYLHFYQVFYYVVVHWHVHFIYLFIYWHAHFIYLFIYLHVHTLFSVFLQVIWAVSIWHCNSFYCWMLANQVQWFSILCYQDVGQIDLWAIRRSMNQPETCVLHVHQHLLN